jgi:hypothetical protein
VIRHTMDAYELNGAARVTGLASLANVREIDGWARAFAARATAGVQSIP